MKRFLLFFWLVSAMLTCCGIFFCNDSFGQPPVFSLHGFVVNEDKQPVSYATVRLAGRGIGTAANAGGEFLLKVLPGDVRDTIEVSCAGYRLRRLPMTAFVDLSQHGMTAPDEDPAAASVAERKLFTVVLETNSGDLQAVSVSYRDPMKILAKAVSRIGVNYLSSPHVLRGFYRQMTMKGGTALELSEAVFDIFGYGYTDKRPELFHLIKARDDKNQRDFHGIEFGQKPESIFNDDIVRRLETSKILGKDGIRRHRYEVTGITSYEGRPAYEISFSEKEGQEEDSYRGRVLIDTASYAFVFFDYGLSPGGMKHFKLGSGAERMMMKLMGLELTVKADRDRIRYQRIGDKWVFAGDAGVASLYVKCPRLHYDFLADVRFNYVVTQVDTTQKEPIAGTLRSGEHINDHDTEDGSDFWKDYNIMLPDANTERLFAQIKSINETLRLKSRFEEMERKLPKDPVVRMDSMLTFYHTNGQFNGTALVASGGKVLLSKSYGWADKENNVAASEHTTYRIGSLSKSFTSVLVCQLMAEGKIDVHAPVKTYLPWYVHGNVTIGQLLTHQSGIPDYFNSDASKQQMVSGSYLLKDVVEKFCSDTLEFAPGTAFSYSNSNFTVLALVAEAVTGRPFGQLLQERIFVPAGMGDSFFGSAAGHQGQAIGYTNGERELSYDPANTAGAGGIWASSSDLLKFDRALSSGGLLPAALSDTMFRPRVEFKDYGAWYGYGWMIDKDYFPVSKRHTVVYHPGTDLGFFTMFLRVPDSDVVVVLLNSTGEFPRYDMAGLILGELRL